MTPSSTPLRRGLPLLAAVLVSGAGQAAGARSDSSLTSIGSACVFLVAIVSAAWLINRPWWRAADTGDIGPAHGISAPVISARNLQLMALIYGWGSVSLLAIYLLTPLRWQHGWQYGLGAGVIALLILAGARCVTRHWSRDLPVTLARLALLHGWAAMGGAAWLIGSGKWFSLKGDWAANVVFLVGGLVVAVVSTIALRTGRYLASPAADQR